MQESTIWKEDVEGPRLKFVEKWYVYLYIQAKSVCKDETYTYIYK